MRTDRTRSRRPRPPRVITVLLLVGIVIVLVMVDRVLVLIEEIAAGRGVIPRGWSEAYQVTSMTQLVTLVAMLVAVVVLAFVFWWRDRRLVRDAIEKFPPRKP